MSLLTPLKTALAAREPALQTQEAMAHANSNSGRNVYLAMDRERILAEAEAVRARFPDPTQRPPLFGVPIGVKDCFDVAGYPTTCGKTALRQLTPPWPHGYDKRAP
jgi:Asp-tRNA(Asn)/Glu-tRNA(Gln) amidotransferase A subunit family amidase